MTSRTKYVTGLEEIDRNLSHFPEKMQKAAYRQGLTAAARPVRDKARELAAKRSGRMARAIKSGSPRRNADGTFSINVRPDGPHAYLAIFQEYGTLPHYIRPGNSGLSARQLTKKARRGEATSSVAHRALMIGGNFITGEVLHPGNRAQPFLRPAADMAFDDAVQAFADKIRAYMSTKTGLTLTGEGDD